MAICLLPISTYRMRNDGDVVASSPFLNSTTRESSGESMSKANKNKLSLEERKARRREYNKQYNADNKEKRAKYRAANKESIAAYERQYRADNKEAIAAREKQYRADNKEAITARENQYAADNKEARSAYSKQYNADNKEAISARNKQYHAANKELIAARKKLYNADNKEAAAAYIKKRRQEDVDFRIACNLRGSLSRSVRDDAKSGSAVRDLGCSIDFLKENFKGRFYKDENGVMMTWDNWGKVWEIDHNYPLAAADLKDRTETLAVVNWRNLQPLTIKENREKSDKVTLSAQRLFNKLVKEFS